MVSLLISVLHEFTNALSFRPFVAFSYMAYFFATRLSHQGDLDLPSRRFGISSLTSILARISWSMKLALWLI